MADGFAFVEGDETGGLRVRERVEQHGAHNGEERGGGADAQRHDEDRGESEAGCAGESAEGVAEVMREVFERSDAVLLPEIFVDAARGAELDAGATVGFFRGEPASDVFGALGIEMSGDLAGEIVVTAAATEETRKDHSAPSSVTCSPMTR